MKTFFITDSIPNNFKFREFGAFQRQEMFMRAFTEISEVRLLLILNNQTKKAVHEYKNYLLNKYLNLKIFEISIPNQTFKNTDDDFLKRKYFSILKPVFNRDFHDKLDRILNCNFQKIFIFRLSSYNLIMTKVRKNLPPTYFDFCDLEHILLSRYPGSGELQDLISELEFNAQQVVKKSEEVFVCSEKDKKYLEKDCFRRNINVIPNGVQIQDKPRKTDEPNILFLGTYLYKPNIMAAEDLIGEIFPGIRKKIPEAKLFIAGHLPKRIKYYKNPPPGVIFTGFIDELHELYKHIRIICTPIRVGSGTRIKILEAASFGKPVVSTTVGAEGIEFENGKEILIEDNNENIIKKCLSLLTNNELYTKIKNNSLKKVNELYDRELIINSIKKIITKSC